MIKSKIRGIILISILILAGTVNSLYAQEAIGKVIALEGKAEVQSEQSKEWRALNLKDDIHTKDTIKTGEESRVEIFFIDESNISIGPETTIQVEKLICSPAENHREGKVKVIMGKARFNVGKLFSKDSSFEVRTPTAVAGVKGTSFIVYVTSEQLTQLMGLSGAVTVTSISPEIEGEVLLTSGFIISVEDGAPPGDPIPIGFDELLELLQNLGLLNGEDDGGNGTGDVGENTLLGDLGTGTSGGGQDIIDQPLEEPPSDEILPAPPAPPDDETPPNGVEY